MAGLPPSEIAYEEAHINVNLSTTIIIICNVFTALALLSLFARLTTRRLARAHLGWDDYLAIAATIPLLGLDITGSLIGHWGIGRVLLRVAQDPENFVLIGKTELAGSVFYDLSMALGKLSILALLARVFTFHWMWFKIGVYFWATWTILWWTAGELLIFLECRPLSTSWGVPTQCRPAFSTSVSTSVLNVISDLGILILPQPLIWQLQLPLFKKLAVSLVFLVGIFATAVAIVRVSYLKGADQGTTLDATYSSTVPVIFTVIEPACVLICACLPMTHGLLRLLKKTKLASWFSLSFSRSSRESRLSSKTQSQPLHDREVKPGQWARLDESSLSSQAKSDGQLRTTLSNGNEEFELVTATSTPRGVYRPPNTRDLV